MDNPVYQMSITLNVLNHLGLKLYSNVPAVLSEAVANSWDADAENVVVEISSDRITITDDGHGMTVDDINEKYLTVGYKRRERDATRTPVHKRPVMGRKGIGKLSLFSIADTVEIQSYREEKNGFVMSAKDIEAQISKPGAYTYHPKPLPDDDISLDRRGTRIVLTKLKKRVAHAPTALRKRVARRFSIIGAEYKFAVCINGKPVGIEDRDYFHKLQYLWHYGNKSKKYVEFCNARILEYSQEREGEINIPLEEDANGTNYQVEGWIGTTLGSGDLKDGEDNLNKIVIMVRGKLAQEDILEDFTEGGLYTKYLIGEIHADFLDLDGKEDIATSSRQEIIRDDPRYQALREWVNIELKNIKNQWTGHRREQGIREASQNPAIDAWVSKLPRDRKTRAKSLLGKIGQLTLQDDERKELYRHSVLAFEKLSYKDSLSALDNLSPENIRDFTRVFTELDSIEASLYYQIIQERLKVIETLRQATHEDLYESVIQKHLYEHLWLLDPAWDRATETPLMEQSVKTDFDKIDAQLSAAEKRARFDIKYKMTSGKHVIIELKRAGVIPDEHALQIQIGKYRTALQKLLAKANKNEPIEVVCIVGKPLRQWETPKSQEESKRSLEIRNIRVVLYNELIENAFRSYQAFLDKNKEAGAVYDLIREI